MRKLLILLLGVVVLAALPVQAQIGQFRYPQGEIHVDSLIWKASGSVPGSNVRTDTLIAGTLNDTTVAIDIGGAAYVAAQFYGVSHNDKMDFTITPQVSATNAATGRWRSLATTFSVANTVGAAVGQTANTGRDTTVFVLRYQTGSDSVMYAAASRGVVISCNADNLVLGASRYLRFWIDPDGASGDTTYLSCVVTKVYPAR